MDAAFNPLLDPKDEGMPLDIVNARAVMKFRLGRISTNKVVYH